MTQHNKSVVIIVFEFVFEQWCCNVVINNKPVKSRDVILNIKLINMSAMCLSVGLLFHRMDMIMFNTKTHTYIDYRKPTGFFYFCVTDTLGWDIWQWRTSEHQWHLWHLTVLIFHLLSSWIPILYKTCKKKCMKCLVKKKKYFEWSNGLR